MSDVRRVYVEKKEPYAVKARQLGEEIAGYLGISGVTKVRELIRYDIENLSEKTYQQALRGVFSEPPVDDVYETEFPHEDSDFCFGVEFLPGQFDQRADSAVQCVKFIEPDAAPTIRTAVIYCISGELTEDEKEKIRNLCINPVDSREASFKLPETLKTVYKIPADVKIFDGFKDMKEADLKDLYDSLSLAMTFRDFQFIQDYFRDEEKRDPSMTEIRVLDTYWSDHCRHTTFSTELTDVKFDEGAYRTAIEAAFNQYLADFREQYAGRDDKFVCLMDMATLATKKLKREGKLTDQEKSNEINACSIVVPVKIDGKEEEWPVNFKNETHNHPTEIEPFGGAATCLGGAIRDPLSGRTYVYQAMRVTGAADPTVPVEKTLTGKLPQRKIVTEAAQGYSSYGNQIGLATGYVKELYHPNYVAKRMEIGAVIAAAPRSAVIREESRPDYIIILLGGRTGRDGIGGATGSSKAHNVKSIEEDGAEVQKGNAPTERKMQRLFRRPEVTKLIRKCNDFGAGGVSVAIGELADGLDIDLDKVPKKYEGLDGTELAISESQERMAVVVAPEDVDEFLKYADEENLETTKVAVVTEKPRLVMHWRGKVIADLSRAFMNTNGAHQETAVEVEMPDQKTNALQPAPAGDVRDHWLKTLSDLNECSQKGLVERFDASIGAGSVLLPYGGRTQLTETQAMVGKLPVLHGKCDTVTMMAYGFDPYLSSWSPFHGAQYAVVDSVAKIVAAGGDWHKIHFTFQEYFRRMSEDPKRWSQPFVALLGAYQAQLGFEKASIGGKDSMSGTFENIDVPPTLVSFAVDVADEHDIISPEFKKAGSKLVLFEIRRDANDLPDYRQIRELYDGVHKLIQEKAVISAYVLDRFGLVPAVSKMGFGNGLGAALDPNLDEKKLFSPAYGCILAEVDAGKIDRLPAVGIPCHFIGEVTDDGAFTYGDVKVTLDEALAAWKKPLEKVFPTVAVKGKEEVASPLYKADSIYVCKHKVARPTVFIPVFPGTNCEYDSAAAFERAGADTVIRVFRNLTAQGILDSVDEFEKAIRQAQIIMFPGGFSAGDEPDGSAKFFATAFRNEKIREAVDDLLTNRDGLALGICNGFQALIKLGLVPNGRITGQDEKSPTLTFNTIGRHISKVAYTKVVSNKSPWLQEAKLGGVYASSASHGEGRFVAPADVLDQLFANGQVATQYCDQEGRTSMDEEYNINGSYRAVEGITSADGRVLGKMCHVERRGDHVAINIYGDMDMKVFESGVKYFS